MFLWAAHKKRFKKISLKLPWISLYTPWIFPEPSETSKNPQERLGTFVQARISSWLDRQTLALLELLLLSEKLVGVSVTVQMTRVSLGLTPTVDTTALVTPPLCVEGRRTTLNYTRFMAQGGTAWILFQWCCERYFNLCKTKDPKGWFLVWLELLA